MGRKRMGNMIKLDQISKSYDKNILKNLSHTFQDESVTCLFGASGRGKTTLLRLIAGLEQPNEGEIRKDGHEKVSFCFQENRLVEGLSALTNLRLVVREKSKEELQETLREVGIMDPNQLCGSMSGGMKRRVAVARALLYEGNPILLDEPFQGLDEQAKAQVIELIKKRRKGRILIVATHDWADLERLGAEAFELED